jgi:polyisoprenoid-binding protein YceI
MTRSHVRPTPTIPTPGTYRLDHTRSAVQFTTRHLFGAGAVRGTFGIRDGVLSVADPVERSWARATVDAASFSSRHPVRDANVRSARLLDVGRYPDITFVSDRLVADDGRWWLDGSLTVRGASAPVRVAVAYVSESADTLRVRASARVDRYAFGITRYRGIAARRLDVRLDVVAHRT